MAEPNTYRLMRPSDLVSLTVTAAGMHVQTGPGGPMLVAGDALAELIVDLPPQHVGETVPTNGGSTSQTRLAGPSRLRFTVDSQPIALSVSGILSAMNRLPLTPRTNANASTLELPWRVLMEIGDSASVPPDPDARTRCAHRTAPATGSADVSELWHTRVMQGRTYAAVYPQAVLPLGGDTSFAADTPLGGFFSQIDTKATAHPDQPMDVERLILSAVGAWFGGSISWDNHALDWTHRAAMGRDFYVYVLESGVLFPFGHKAALVMTFEREFSSGKPPLAALREHTSLVVIESTRSYDSIAERQFPFQVVELTSQLIDELDEPPSTTMFWPMRSGTPVLFPVRAHAAGDVVEMALPLLFSADSERADLADIYAHGPPFNPGPPTASVGRSMAIAMKSSTEALDGAVQQVNSLTFGGKPTAGQGVGFHPVVTGLEIGLPAVRQLLGQDEPLSARLSKQLLEGGPAELPDVLLELTNPQPLNFSSARAGVVAAPNITVDEVSRKLGPIMANLPTDPAALFPDADLLGIVPLRTIIATGTAAAPTITWSRDEHPTAILSWEQALAAPSLPLPFKPTPGATCAVKLTVETQPDAAAAGPPPVKTNGEIQNFTLVIPPDPAPALLELQFDSLSFEAVSGALPTATFVIAGATLTGSLAFVQKLQESLPSVGNTAPTVDVNATGITATFVAAVPSPLSMGAFTLRNLLLKAAITLSFVNEPVLVEFAWASQDQPFQVAVAGFGGGGYLELAIRAGGDDGGLTRFVGALEFGACAAMDFGVAAGEVHVFGGVVFKKVGSSVEITGYLRIGGMVRVLGLISVSVELTVAMTYVPNRLTGSAKLVITVDLTFWSTSVEIGCSKSFGGSEVAAQPSAPALGARPGVAFAAFAAFDREEQMSVQESLGRDGQTYPWQTYCLAFAGE